MNTEQPSWRVCDATDPLSLATVQRNILDLAIASSCLPDWEECVDDVRSRLAVRMGLTAVSYTHLRAHETDYTISYAVFCL